MAPRCVVALSLANRRALATVSFMVRCFLATRVDVLDRPLDVACTCVDAIETTGAPLSGPGVKVAAPRRTP